MLYGASPTLRRKVATVVRDGDFYSSSYGGSHPIFTPTELHLAYRAAGYPYGKSLRGIKKFKDARRKVDL